MKRTFSATVLGISHTDTSDFATGAHSVSFDILFTQAPLGQVPRRVDLPLFSAEEARELGSLYRKNGAISVTVQTASAENIAAVETMRRESLRSAIEETVATLYDAMSGRMPTVDKCRSVSANLRDAAGAMLGSGIVPIATVDPSPIVNGKPSCCEPVKGSGIRIAALDGSSRHGWALGAHIGIKHCLYCGTKLPALDGTPS